jgi:hypothetical protein
MTFAQRRISERIPVVKRRMTVPRAVELLRYKVSVTDMWDAHSQVEHGGTKHFEQIHKHTCC